MSYSLCNRCDNYGVCGLNYDGKPCRKLRTVEPTNYDRIMDMDAEQLAAFLVKRGCPPGKHEKTSCFKDWKEVESRCTACWLEYLNEETKEDLT